MRKNIVIITCSILDLTDEVVFLDILASNERSLEDFTSDIKSMVLNTSVSMINKVSMSIDILHYAQCENLSYNGLAFEREIRNLIHNMVYRINQVSVRGMRLVDIKLLRNSTMSLIWEQ